MDSLDRRLVEQLQAGFPIEDEPFRAIAGELGIGADEVIARLERLLEAGVISRFGPLYQAERMGGAYVLAAMRVPDAEFEAVAARVNAHPEVAHNYRREHDFSMWFVVAAGSPEAADAALDAIERATEHAVYRFPKEREYFVGMRLPVRETA